jgi:hypothetical protein
VDSEIWEAAMGWACGFDGEDRECIQNVDGEISWNTEK